MFSTKTAGFVILAALFAAAARASDRWPELPATDATIAVPAQEWPFAPGLRTVNVMIHYPRGRLDRVGPQTGLMLSLHNWGGTGCAGTANPRALAERYDLVVLCVDYLQSGRPSIDGPEPYDFGYLQALDALRGLFLVYDRLRTQGHPFDSGRIYATGGSGGGNVTLMCNKLAPRTFAAVIDLCGMKKLSDDIAFNVAGGSDLDARYSRDTDSPYFLSVDAQELRFLGCPEHVAVMRGWGNTCRVIVVHGRDDTTCPFADAREFVESLQQGGLTVEPNFIGADQVDGRVFTTTGHALGDRTQIVFRVADKYLLSDSPDRLVRRGPPDFDRRGVPLRYRTSGGAYVISYAAGYPVGSFEPAVAPRPYPEHLDLSYRLEADGTRHPVRTPADWETRRRHVLANLQQVMGRLPGPGFRIPLDVRVVNEERIGTIIRRKITFQSDPDDRVSAYLLLPDVPAGHRAPAVLCLHQTTRIGKDEPAGLGGHADLHYALELAQRGFVTLAPDYPSFGEHPYDFDERHGYASGSLKAVWDNIRAIDYLQTLDAVDPNRVGCLGHSLGGHSAMFTAVFEPRIKVIVSSCGFCRFHKDDVPSWTGKNYMPRIAILYENNADKVPFDFTEIIAAFAPRPFLACAADRDSDFDVTGVRETLAAARPIYELHKAADRLRAYYPAAEHSFPKDARAVAYEFLETHLKGK